MKQPAFALATHLELPPVASVPSRFATARSEGRRKRRMPARGGGLGSPASDTSPPATSVKVGIDFACTARGAVGVAAPAADDEVDPPAKRAASAAPPSRLSEAAIDVEAGPGERMACRRSYGAERTIPPYRTAPSGPA